MIYFGLACLVFFLVLCVGAVVEFITGKVKEIDTKKNELANNKENITSDTFVVAEEPNQSHWEQRHSNQGKGWTKPVYKGKGRKIWAKR